jgi:hypothetical protein
MRTSLIMLSLIVSGLLGTVAEGGVMTPPPDGAAPVVAAADLPVLISSSEGNPSAAGLMLLPVWDLSASSMGELSPRIDLRPRSRPAEVVVEPIPTPSALTAGLAVLGGLAAFRLVRRLRFA